MAVITQDFVDNLKTKEFKQVYFDDDERHFGVRIYPTGRKSYVIRYKIGYANHLKTIASCSAMDAERAREYARSVLILAKTGL